MASSAGSAPPAPVEVVLPDARRVLVPYDRGCDFGDLCARAARVVAASPQPAQEERADEGALDAWRMFAVETALDGKWTRVTPLSCDVRVEDVLKRWDASRNALLFKSPDTYSVRVYLEDETYLCVTLHGNETVRDLEAIVAFRAPEALARGRRLHERTPSQPLGPALDPMSPVVEIARHWPAYDSAGSLDTHHFALRAPGDAEAGAPSAALARPGQGRLPQALLEGWQRRGRREDGVFRGRPTFRAPLAQMDLVLEALAKQAHEVEEEEQQQRQRSASSAAEPRGDAPAPAASAAAAAPKERERANWVRSRGSSEANPTRPHDASSPVIGSPASASPLSPRRLRLLAEGETQQARRLSLSQGEARGLAGQLHHACPQHRETMPPMRPSQSLHRRTAALSTEASGSPVVSPLIAARRGVSPPPLSVSPTAAEAPWCSARLPPSAMSPRESRRSDKPEQRAMQRVRSFALLGGSRSSPALGGCLPAPRAGPPRSPLAAEVPCADEAAAYYEGVGDVESWRMSVLSQMKATVQTVIVAFDEVLLPQLVSLPLDGTVAQLKQIAAASLEAARGAVPQATSQQGDTYAVVIHIEDDLGVHESPTDDAERVDVLVTLFPEGQCSSTHFFAYRRVIGFENN
eukprot:m51a1_g7392 hypothetical protein (635) ;mRNA; r:136682-138846